MTDILIAIIISGVLSILIAFIEVSNKSKTSLRALLGVWFFIYILILALGNTATTLLSFPIVAKVGITTLIRFWAPFFGVFAFQSVIKNLNISFYDRGALTISDWIDKARDRAVAASLGNQETLEHNTAVSIANKLLTIDETTINTYVLDLLGPTAVKDLEGKAVQSSANPHYLKALGLARMKPEDAAAIAKYHLKHNP